VSQWLAPFLQSYTSVWPMWACVHVCLHPSYACDCDLCNVLYAGVIGPGKWTASPNLQIRERWERVSVAFLFP